jgi:Zn-dependent peptidase ImmA (M78 family)
MNLRESLDIVKKYWNTAPVPVDTIASELGVPVLRVDLPNEISGAIRKEGNGYQIIVNRNHALTRQRFTIAHEIGHFIYHRDLLGAGTGDTRAYRAEGTPFPNPNITALQERQANTFAANLLMPKHLIEKLQSQGTKDIPALAKALLVSEEALRIRLGRKQDDYGPRQPGEDEVEAHSVPR